MAIKGKRKSRGGGRRVAAPPRPALVPPKVPPLRRRGVRIFLAIVLVLGAVLGTILTLQARTRARELDDARRQVREFETRVGSALTTHGVAQETPTGYVVLPDFGPTLSMFEQGEAEEAELAEQLQAWSESAGEAAAQMATVDVGIHDWSNDLTEARNLMRQGLLLYGSMSRTLGVATDVEGERREELIGVLMEQFPTAAAVFDSGWQMLQRVRAELEIPREVSEDPTAPPGIPGAPGEFGEIPGQLPEGIEIPEDFEIPEGFEIEQGEPGEPVEESG